MWAPLDPGKIGVGHPCDVFTVESEQHRQHGYLALMCDNCGATWVGPLGERCIHCIAGIERRHQQ